MGNPTHPTAKKGNPPADWQARFFASLRLYGNISYAAKAAKVTRTYVHDLKKTDVEFAALWADALDEAADALEKAAWQRATKGVKKTKSFYHQGERVGEDVITEYSDTLLMFLLKATRPEKFRERYDHSIHSPDSNRLVIEGFGQALDTVYGSDDNT